ncbi:Uncharacterized conserved protein, DUF1501 family [Neorhodopirellula lusitana]|uniref:Uncharacterized conserved protein, DUF1501 family n=1 Tax=Neorhodopirellula lusitana TaxID=445327 RepID=A0ABY1Q1A4_9BACT|nr:DUF1501 domain-containing protein [Neorhodopirellula lusitana]SMP54436.1 Uncharacterized conserved protein, DUF1501 family [Neorhodopirellula lusitana]
MACQGNPMIRPGVFGRRGFLVAGSAAGLGLSLPELLMHQAAAEKKQYDFIKAKAKSVIHIFLPGGIAQQESFDPKPYSPLEYRGEMGTVKTNTGEVICNSLPRLAKQADKYCVIRSMSHGEAAHERGTHNMFTGYKPSPALQYPSFGAVVSHEYGPRNNLPAYICIPNVPNEYAGTGYLPSKYSGFALGADPARDDFKVRDLNLAGGVDADRFVRRREMLEKINQRFNSATSADNVSAMNTFYERAYGLLDTPAAKEAFDLSKEDAKMRDRYGRNQAGSRMLMARRLVEAGSRLVTLTYGSWDMHTNLTTGIKSQMPAFDQGVSALLEDLSERGMLDETLVMVTSEFGRTPKINADAGRDHWPKVFSVMLAGGGVKGGIIHGASDATATEPDSDPVSPADLATTMYHLLGIVADKELMAPGARPIEIVDGGKLVNNILV